jgi:hypothetical protein
VILIVRGIRILGATLVNGSILGSSLLDINVGIDGIAGEASAPLRQILASIIRLAFGILSNISTYIVGLEVERRRLYRDSRG